MLQSYAAVYCGDQQRSYHGTTLGKSATRLQLVTPKSTRVVPCNDKQSSRVSRTIYNTKFHMNAKQKHPESNDKILFHVVAKYRHFIDYVILPVQLKYSVYRRLPFDC